MNTIEKSGKTVEDAVEAGLLELKLTSSDVDIEVLEYGSPGLFGMFGKLARVKLTVKKRDDDFDFDMPRLSLDRTPGTKQNKVKPPRQEKQAVADKPENESAKPEQANKEKQRVAAVRQDAVVKQEKPKSEAPNKEAQKQEKPKTETVKTDRQKDQPSPKPNANTDGKGAKVAIRQERPAKARIAKPAKKIEAKDEKPDQSAVVRPPMEMMTMEDLPPIELDKLSDDAKKAYDFLINTTKLMGVDVEIRMREKEGQLQIQMSGDTLGVLIGRRGETLDALQYLTSLKVNKGREEYMRVTLDTEHYRAKREEALRRLAERMANRARKTGRRVALEPMNPYERRVLHSALQDNEFVTTHSEGEDPYRRVIITLKQ